MIAFMTGTMMAFSQEDSTATGDENPAVSKTFNSTRILGSHSIETLYKGELEYRIEHRFGDFAGTNGGAEQAFGFDEAKDIRFALEYGLSNKLMFGIARTKGSTASYRSNLDGFLKYRILQQKAHGMPISMTLVTSALYSYAKASSDSTSFKAFPKFSHRFAYATQLNIGSKVHEYVSLSFMPTWVHRNYVNANEKNDLISLGFGGRFKLSHKWAILTEYFHTLKGANNFTGITDVFAIGAAWSTFGHNFHFSLSNASLFNEAQFIPFTTEKWGKGQFRLGFSISRSF